MPPLPPIPVESLTRTQEKALGARSRVRNNAERAPPVALPGSPSLKQSYVDLASDTSDDTMDLSASVSHYLQDEVSHAQDTHYTHTQHITNSQSAVVC